MIANPLSSEATNDTPPSGSVSRVGRFTPVDPLRLMRQYATLLVITSVLSVILGVGLWWLLRQYSPRYTSVSQLTITGGISDPYQLMQQSGGVSQLGVSLIDTFIKNQIVRITSDEVVDGALKRDDVRATKWFRSFKGDTQDARSALQKMMSADRIKGSTLIGVSFSTWEITDPPVIVDAVVQVYLERLAVESGRESDDVRRALVRERDRAEEHRRQIEEQLKQFTILNDLSALETRNHEANIAYKALAEQRTELELELQAVREVYPALVNAQKSGTVNFTPQQLALADADPSVAARNERLLSLREQREVMRDRLGPQHRMVRQIDLQIQATEEEKKRQIDHVLRRLSASQLEQTKQLIDSLQAQLQALQPRVDEAHAQLRDLGLKLEEHARIKERANDAAKRYAKVDELLNAMRIQTDRPDSTQVRQVFRATQAELTFPRVIIIVPGITLFLVGLVGGLVFLKESLDQRVKSPADVTMISDYTLLGVIPDTAEDPSNPSYVEGIVRVSPSGLMAESFRQVRAAMSVPIERNKHQVLLMVGAQPQSGTSVVANNLAISMAYEGRRVLLLDANYRQPAQHRLFGVTTEPGLIEVVRGVMAFDDAVVHIDTPAMDILPIGRASDGAPEIFEGEAFGKLLDELRSRYDLIMIDAPPALLATDSMVMAKRADAAVVVVRAMEDMRGMIGRLLRQFSSQRIEVLGLILNRARSSAGGYFRKNYQAFYRYHQAGTDGVGKSKSKPEPAEAGVER